MSEQFIHDGSGPDVDPATGDEAETKGPDPEVWGDPSTRPSPEPAGQEIVLAKMASRSRSRDQILQFGADQ